MGLFKPAWQSDNEEKALSAVDKETNIKIATQALLDSVRNKANRKYQSYYYDIAVENCIPYLERESV